MVNGHPYPVEFHTLPHTFLGMDELRQCVFRHMYNVIAEILKGHGNGNGNVALVHRLSYTLA